MPESMFPASIPHQEPTPPEVFFNRRTFLKTTAAVTLLGATACGQDDSTAGKLTPPLSRPDVFPAGRNDSYRLPTSIERKHLTPRDIAAGHTNYYEFLAGRGGPSWKYAGKFEVDPWSVEVTGLCDNPMTIDLDALFKFPHEERLYHFRCVERWAMNVPWTGFPLRALIEKAKPTAEAKYVRFFTANRPEQMPGLKVADYYPWPYYEALRMDEAMNELAMVVTGVYGKPLLKQHGAPVRIIVPWKYGYKSPKSIVKIEFVKDQPDTFWQLQPHEYGFLSNVNPNIPHPRWSQSRSRWLDTNEEFETPIFNGYNQYVGDLYPDEPRTPQKPLRAGQTAR